MTPWGFALLVLLAQEPVPRPATPASVEGVVVKQGSGVPLSGVSVELAGVGRRDGAFTGVYTATTAQDGKFALENVAPGEYRLESVRSGGYLPAAFGQRTPGGRGATFRLEAGQKMTGVRLVMASPTGSIAGRVYDHDGEPTGRAQVQALKSVYRDGHRRLTILRAVETNDRGEYRLYWLPPGQYYVVAKPDQPRPDFGPQITFRAPQFGEHEEGRAPFVRSRTASDGAVVEEAFVPVYYPGTTDVQAATAVVVGEAAAVGGVDVPVAPGLVRTRRIRGFAIDVVTGQPLAGASVLAIPRTTDPNVLIPSARSEPDGSFDLAGVVPGPYIVFAGDGHVTGGVALDVGDDDVQGLAINATPGFRISGRFVVEGRSRGGAGLSLPELRATLQRDPDILGMPNGGPTFSPPPSEDGAFALEGVGIGDFAVSIRGLPPGAYLKSMRMGIADVLAGGLHVFGAPKDPLEIVIGAEGGSLAGRVVSAAQEPLVNRTVVVVPAPTLRERADLFKSDSTDGSGRFRIQGLAPGEYKVFAWETVESGAWRDPDFLRGYENVGKTIRVSEDAEQVVELTIIP